MVSVRHLIPNDTNDNSAYRGKDFRKSFSVLGDLRALTKAPVLSMTASAPPRVEAELVRQLHLRNPVFVKSSLNRPNIFLCLRTKSKLEVSAYAVLLFIV